MRVQNVNEHELEVVARSVGVCLRNVCTGGRDIRFGLTVLADKTWRRHNPATKRPLQGVCIHGHEAFARTLFQRHPDARLYTALLGRNVTSRMLRDALYRVDSRYAGQYPLHTYCACRAGLLAYGDGIHLNCPKCQTAPCFDHRVVD